MTASSSPEISKKINVEKLLFVKKQIIFFVVALMIMIIISFLNQTQIKLLSIFGLLVVIILLFMVLRFGEDAKGAKRWIEIYGFNFQPSEFAKTFFLVFNALLLQKLNNKSWITKYGLSSLFYLIVISLIILQPDFGMTLTLTILWSVQLFIFGIPSVIVVILAIFGLFGFISAYIYLPHVQNRIDVFLSQDSENYQVERSIDAYINGGIFGTGPGEGLVKKYIPDAHTDFIFAVIGEEFGAISCLTIIIILFLIITRITKNLVADDNLFSYLAAGGLLCQFAMQSMVNIGVSIGMFPTKGMTLPFISYGGSSLIAMSVCFGIIFSLTKKKYESKTSYNYILN